MKGLIYVQVVGHVDGCVDHTIFFSVSIGSSSIEETVKKRIEMFKCLLRI